MTKLNDNSASQWSSVSSQWEDVQSAAYRDKSASADQVNELKGAVDTYISENVTDPTEAQDKAAQADAHLDSMAAMADAHEKDGTTNDDGWDSDREALEALLSEIAPPGAAPLYSPMAAQSSDEEEGGVTGISGSNGTQGGYSGAENVDEADGSDGSDGSDGVDETDGSDGSDGVDETDGSDGSDGVDETDGSDGSDGVDETDGSDGSDETGDGSNDEIESGTGSGSGAQAGGTVSGAGNGSGAPAGGTVSGVGDESGTGWGNLDLNDPASSATYKGKSLDEMLADHNSLVYKDIGNQQDVIDAIKRVSKETGIPEGLLASVIVQETNGDRTSTSDNPGYGDKPADQQKDAGLVQAPLWRFEGATTAEKLKNAEDPYTNLTNFADEFMATYKQTGSYGVALQSWYTGDIATGELGGVTGGYSNEDNYAANVFWISTGAPTYYPNGDG